MLFPFCAPGIGAGIPPGIPSQRNIPRNSLEESEAPTERSQPLSKPSGMDGKDGGNQLSSAKVFSSSWENRGRRSSLGKGCKKDSEVMGQALLCQQIPALGVGGTERPHCWGMPWLGKGPFRESCGVQEASFALKRSAGRCKMPYVRLLRPRGGPGPAGCGTGGVVTYVAKNNW